MLKKILCFTLAALMLCGMSFCVSANEPAVPTVVYENDFSDPATLADFNQFRSVWEIKDGKLWITGPADDITDTETFGHIILNKNVTWRNYIVEADIENVQTSTGIVCRVNNELADAQTANSFAGFLGFLSNNAKSGAMGRSNPTDHTAWGGNYEGSVIAAGTDIGSSVHMKITVLDDTFTLEIFDLDTGLELYNNIVVTDEWQSGTVGFRARFNNAGTGANSFGTVSFDNLKVTLINDETAPATEAVTEAPKTEAPATEAPKTEAPKTEAPKTEAPKTEAPKTEAPKTDAPATDAPATDAPATSAPTTEPAEGANIGLIAGIAAAVIVAAVIVVIIIKKKKN